MGAPTVYTTKKCRYRSIIGMFASKNRIKNNKKQTKPRLIYFQARFFICFKKVFYLNVRNCVRNGSHCDFDRCRSFSFYSF